MKLEQAMAIIEGKALRQGFLVHFEVREVGTLRSDYFPDVHAREEGIPNEEGAWKLAAQFAHAKHARPVVNVYVVHASDFTPVPSYRARMLNIYPPP